MCECGFHSCIVCEDTSPCSDMLVPNPECHEPVLLICNSCLEQSVKDFFNMRYMK